MTDLTNESTDAGNYLHTLEKVKRQYQQYVEVSELYKLPRQAEAEPQYVPPSIDNPLTSNSSLLTRDN